MPKKKDDPLHPLSRFLADIAKNAANISADALKLFLGIREAGRVKGSVRLEFYKLKQQVERTGVAIDQLNDILEVLDKGAKETNEHDFINLALRITEGTQMSEQMSGVLALDHIAVAHRLLKLSPEKFPEVIRELASYQGGKEQLTRLFKAVIQHYGEEWADEGSSD